MEDEVDGFDFAVGFFGWWVRDALDDAEARRLLYTDTLTRALDEFHFDSDCVGKFRRVYERWERAARFRKVHAAQVVANRRDFFVEEFGMTVKQEVNKVLEIAEAIEALSEASKRYLLELIDESANDRNKKATQTNGAPKKILRPCGCGPVGRHRIECTNRKPVAA